MNRTAAILICTLVAPLVADAGSGDAERGAERYLGNACYTCHGYNGTGMTPLAGRRDGMLSSERLFLTYLRLRADQQPVNPSRDMPHYSESALSDADALDIYAYILSLEDDPPPVDEIPAFRAILEQPRRRPERESEDE